MDMRAEKGSIQLERPLGRCESLFPVEGDVTLPGSLRETTNILHTCDMAVVESAEAMQDRVNVSGRVIFRVIYTQGNSAKAESIEAAADFTHVCEMKGAQPGSEVFACAEAAHASAAVQGGRVHMKAEVQLHARAVLGEPMEVITGAGLPDAEKKKAQVRLRRTVGRGSADVLLREEFALPAEMQIQDTLGATASVRMTDTAGGQGRIGLSGEVVIEAVHTSSVPGKPLVVTRHTVPVSQSVEIRGEGGDLLDGRMVVKDVAVASQDAGDGERTLRSEVLLGLSAWADREEEASLLQDAYTTQGDMLRLTSAPVAVRTGDQRIHAAESGKAALLLPEGAQALRTMLAAFAVPVMTGHNQSGNRLIVEGVLETTLIYMPQEGDAPVSARMDAPFRAAFALSAAPDDILTLTVDSVEAVPVTSDRAEMRYILHLDVDGLQTQQVSVVTEAAAVPAAVPVKDIVLYFTQPGETVWDIAKRYRVTQSDLHRLNPDLPEEPKAGQGVVVWRRNHV